MEIRIKYNDDIAQGSISATEDFSQVIWNRIREVAIGLQPDVKIIKKTLEADWNTILAIAPQLSYLRKEFGFSISYDDSAKALLKRYREEFKAIRSGNATQRIELTEEAIPEKLIEFKFTQRQLKPYQIRDLAKMVKLSNGANFSVPGAGKTTVAFAAHVLTRDEDTKLLIVAPKNAFSAWDDVVNDCMDSSVKDDWSFTRLVGGYDSIKTILLSPLMRMIITYEQLTRVQDIITNFLTINKVHIILDESHRMKSGDRSQRGATLLRLAHLPIRRDILSGTPIPRSIDDIGPQLDFLWPGQTLSRRVHQEANAHDVLTDLYVRTTKHELGLKKPKRHFIQVPMSPPQVALYSLVRQEVLKQLSGIRTNSNIDLATSKRSVIRLLQISSNPILVVRRLTEEQPSKFSYDDPKIEAIFKSIVEEMDSPKIIEACRLARFLASRNEKSVIWTSFTENVERIAHLLADLGATFIHGGVDAGDESDSNTREGRIKHFHQKDSKCKVLVANPAACSEGISLHKVCHNAIYVDRSFNAGQYLQSVDRIHRLGLEPGTDTHIHILESVAPDTVGAIDFAVRRRLIIKLRTMFNVLEDFDLHQLALDEEEADIPIDYDISLDDLADIIDELVGMAQPPGHEEEVF